MPKKKVEDKKGQKKKYTEAGVLGDGMAQKAKNVIQGRKSKIDMEIEKAMGRVQKKKK